MHAPSGRLEADTSRAAQYAQIAAAHAEACAWIARAGYLDRRM